MNGGTKATVTSLFVLATALADTPRVRPVNWWVAVLASLFRAPPHPGRLPPMSDAWLREHDARAGKHNAA